MAGDELIRALLGLGVEQPMVELREFLPPAAEENATGETAGASPELLALLAIDDRWVENEMQDALPGTRILHNIGAMGVVLGVVLIEGLGDPVRGSGRAYQIASGGWVLDGRQEPALLVVPGDDSNLLAVLVSGQRVRLFELQAALLESVGAPL